MSWQKVSGASKHLGLSVRTVRELLNQGLPHSRLPSGTILVNLDDADEWLRGFDSATNHQQIVKSVLRRLK